MQLQIFLKPIKKETNRLVQSFFTENPEIMKSYVDGSVAVIGQVLKPLNSFMRHLLVVQGLDPDTTPGERDRILLREALDSVFASRHQKDFDDDFDFAWVQKKFNETQQSLKQLQLTKEQFVNLTDVSKLGFGDKSVFGQEVIDQVVPAEKKEIPIVASEVTENAGKIYEKQEVLGDPIADLKAIIEIEKKIGFKPGKNKLNKKPDRISTFSRKRRIAGSTQRRKEIVDKMLVSGFIDEKDLTAQMQEMTKWDNESLEAIDRVLDKHTETKVKTKFGNTFKRTDLKVK